jgi:hypothetical protein
MFREHANAVILRELATDASVRRVSVGDRRISPAMRGAGFAVATPA